VNSRVGGKTRLSTGIPGLDEPKLDDLPRMRGVLKKLPDSEGA